MNWVNYAASRSWKTLTDNRVITDITKERSNGLNTGRAMPHYIYPIRLPTFLPVTLSDIKMRGS